MSREEFSPSPKMEEKPDHAQEAQQNPLTDTAFVPPAAPAKEDQAANAQDAPAPEQTAEAFPLKTGEPKPEPEKPQAEGQPEQAAEAFPLKAEEPKPEPEPAPEPEQAAQEPPAPEPQPEAGAADAPEAEEPQPKKKLTAKTKKILAIAGGAAVLLIALIVTALILLSGYLEKKLDVDTFYEGLYIEDVALGGKTMEEAQDLMEELELRSRDPIDLTLQYGDQTFQYDEDDFRFAYNTEEVLQEAYQTGREGNIWLRYLKVMMLKHQPEVLTLNHELDQTDNILAQIAADVAGQLDTEAQDATVKEFNPSAGSTVEEMFVVEDGVVGIEVDQEKLVEDCRAILDSEDWSGTVEISVTETPFEMDAEELLASIQQISSYSTNSTNTANGNHNMANALGRINGTVLQPGEVFSFNGVVGRRTAANGFREAGVISNGVLVDGLGGGVCQASSTVYGAAVRAGMEVVERGNHRWPSSYLPIGQDAMVSWGSQDMKFRNSLDHPIYIKAYMSGTKLHAIIYGTQPEEWDTIEVSSWKTSTLYPGETIRKNDSSLPKGTTKVEVKERYGSTASAQRTYYKDGKKVKTEALPDSRYNPVTGVVRVGTAESSQPAASAAETQQPAATVEE